MKLRTKLLLGYAGFVLALGVLGAWSARTLNQMSGVSGRIISENYDSVVAAQDMKESLERQDSAALFDLQGQRERAMRQAAEHRARFDAAFDKAVANITEPGEAEIIEAIRSGRDEYYRLFDRIPARAGRSHGPVFPRARAPLRRGPGRCRPALASQSGGHARQSGCRVGHRPPMVLHHARTGSGAHGRGRGRRVQPVQGHRRSGPAADRGDDAAGRGGAGCSRPRSFRGRDRHPGRRASTGWPSGSASCVVRTSASCSSRSRRPKRRSIPCTTR